MKEFGNLERIAGNHLPSHVCGFKMFRLLQLCEKSKVQRFQRFPPPSQTLLRFHEDVSNFNFGNCTDAEAADLKIVLTLYKAHPKSAGDSSMEISSMYI
jgi:hypothetical protein